MDISVTKANGLTEAYKTEKVRASMTRAGVPEEFQPRLLSKIEGELYDKISTAKILDIIIGSLKQIYPQGQTRYQLKRAIMEMGPSGFPFEKFVARLLHEYGYSVTTDVVLWGECVSHEVDVLATKDIREYFVECKYHNQPGSRSDVKTALYVKSRGDDLAAKMRQDPKNAGTQYGPWVFTNTKFSSDAITYAECKNIRLTGWSYPQKGNLQEMVETKHLYPITCLTSLTHDEKMKLLDRNIVLISELYKDTALIDSFNLTEEQRDALEYEHKYLSD
ncbi:MAG: restriction endonuclease [Patescibacteria group bacterium]|jgi:hypothetical protein